MSKKQSIQYYTSDKGIYVTSGERDYQNHAIDPPGHRINHKVPTNTHLKGWKFIEGEKEVTSIQIQKSGEIINIRYELIDPSLANDNIPLVIKEEDALGVYDEDDYRHYIGSKSKYYSIRSLYLRKYDTSPPYFEDIEFESEYLGEIVSENVDNVCTAKFKVMSKPGWDDITRDEEIKNIANYYEIEKMLVNELVIHNRPCYLSSYTTYGIIRAFIKDNIDGKYARITSDYDFCFTVKKRIHIKPFQSRSEIYTAKGKSYRPPEYKTYTTSDKEVEIFEMTSAKDKYSKYTVIEGFKGDTLQDLADNIKGYLDTLIATINEPLVECEHCSGTGHVLVDKIDINERK